METPKQPEPVTSQPEQAKRLDHRLTEEGQRAVQALLEQFPDLRSVALAFDYELQDAGDLPAGVWLSRRPLNPREVILSCKSVDRVAGLLRNQHYTAVERLAFENIRTQQMLQAQQSKPEENELDVKKQKSG